MRARLPRLPLLLAALGVASCRQPPPRHHPDAVQRLLATRPGPEPQFRPLPPEEREEIFPDAGPYRIGNGDVLHVQAPGAEFLGFGETTKGAIVGTRVKEDGNLYLPLLGAVPAAGRTVLEVQRDLMERMTRFDRSPFISVDVLEHRSQKYFVLGAVPNPGVFPVDGERTILEAVSLAGGSRPDAALEEAVVIRDSRILPVSVSDMLERGDMTRNVPLRHGDLVFVPHGRDKKVYVLGEVRQPRIVPMERGRITLAEALAAAGGIDPLYADRNQIRIFRGGWAHPVTHTISTIDAYRFGEDIHLRSGDRLLVAPSDLATHSRMMQLVFPLVSQPASLALSGAAFGITATR